MDGLSAGIDTLSVKLNPDADGDTALTIGEPASIEVIAVVGSLTSAPIITMFLPDQLSSSIEFRLELEPDDWGPDANPIEVTC